jgi:hypothetical protein
VNHCSSIEATSLNKYITVTRYRGVINKKKQTENNSTTYMENCISVYQKQNYLSVRLRNNFIGHFKIQIGTG